MVLIVAAWWSRRTSWAARGRLEAGWTALGLAIAGAGGRGVVEVRAHRQASDGRRGLPGRAGDRPARGLREPVAILQAPASWSELLLLSQPVAAVGRDRLPRGQRRTGSRRRAGTWARSAAVLIVGTPYVVGGLVLLESGGLLASPGRRRSRPGRWPAGPRRPSSWAACSSSSASTRRWPTGWAWRRSGRLLRSLRAHLALLAVAVAAVAAPWIAAFGSGAAVASWPVAAALVATVLTTMLSQAGLWAEVYLVTGHGHGRDPRRRRRRASRSSGIPCRA